LYVAKGMPHGTNIGNDRPLAEAFNRSALDALAAALPRHPRERRDLPT
jgi:hypothetical protein